MNSHYLFLTIHGHDPKITMENIQKILQNSFPDCEVSVSNDEFEDVR